MPSHACLVGKRAWLAVSLMTAVEGLAKYFGRQVDVTGAFWNCAKCDSSRPQRVVSAGIRRQPLAMFFRDVDSSRNARD
jgi:hypothetical protein